MSGRQEGPKSARTPYERPDESAHGSAYLSKMDHYDLVSVDGETSDRVYRRV